jgi:hypothetical protein
LILKALDFVKEVPANFIGHCILCLKKNGMTPFAKVFKKLSEKEEIKQKLVDLEYHNRAMSLLLDKTNDNFRML